METTYTGSVGGRTDARGTQRQLSPAADIPALIGSSSFVPIASLRTARRTATFLGVRPPRSGRIADTTADPESSKCANGDPAAFAPDYVRSA